VGKELDHCFKTLARENPQAFVSFALNGDEASFEKEVDRELIIGKQIDADLLYIIRWQGQQVVLHIEFQSKKDDTMDRRVWKYNAVVDYLTNLPVISIVIYSDKSDTIVEGPYLRKLPNGSIVQALHY
jgi:hypothetical protein